MTSRFNPLRLRRWGALAASAAFLATAAALAPGAAALPAVQHVLLISLDGLHASDVAKCEAASICPTIAALAAGGTSYANVSTSKPSDSSPGLMALATGGSPKLTGVYYDDSYDRTMFLPADQSPGGTQTCQGPPGAEMQYFENLDVNAPTVTNTTGTRTIMNEAIDPAQLPMALIGGNCVGVMPNDYLRANSIFSVAHAAGLRTAWADKHPAANEQVAGHGTPNSVDDPFQTEINADIIPSSLVDTRGTTVTFPLPNPTGDPNGFFITDKVGNTEAYDQIKVDAILNEIDGKSSDGTSSPGVPAIFGMNFQSVSVGQKLIDPQLSCTRNPAPNTVNGVHCDPGYLSGGYVAGTLDFTPQLRGAIESVDAQLASMVAELRSQNRLASTEIILTAKHGQSPVDPSTLQKIGHKEGDDLTNAGVVIGQLTDDDVALIWLQDQSQASLAVNALQADQAGANNARIQTIFSGKTLADQFNSPSVDPRTPDIVVQPIPGTIYSHSGAKVAEHGGFAEDDTHVALFVTRGTQLANTGKGGHGGSVVNASVQTAQVAPTILQDLGLDPHALDAVRTEHTGILPG